MSFAVFVARLALIETLKGQTLAEDRVVDSPLDPLIYVNEDPKPLIAVYSGECKGRIDGRDMLAADMMMEFALQVLLPAKMELDVNGQSATFEVRESAAAAVSNMICGQIVRVLQTSRSPWADLWRDLTLPHNEKGTEDISLAPMVFEIADGVRLPAFELRLLMRPLADPPPDGPLPEVWQRAFSLMRGVADYALLADLIDSSVEAKPEWARIAMALGLSARQSTALGIDGVEPVPVSRLSIEQRGIVREVT
jgi:hypothetical protein